MDAEPVRALQAAAHLRQAQLLPQRLRLADLLLARRVLAHLRLLVARRREPVALRASGPAS